MKKVLILGGIGAASTIAAAMIDAQKRCSQEYEFAGYINDKDNLEEIEGYPIVGGIKDISRLVAENYYFINTIYKVDGQVDRVNFFESLEIPHSNLATFIHPTAFISPNCKVGAGVVIMPNANISSGVSLGKNVRIMSGALIGHDNTVADHCFFAANSCIGSHINFEEAAYCGLNCTIGGKLNIGKYSVIGMGSVVTKNVSDFSIVTGNPAKHIRYTKDKI